MSSTPENTTQNHICIGLLAHVDAGKTTLAESFLYLGGKLRRLGRVDHRDAFLDTHELERSRGITIFSKQARFPLGEKQVTLLDTPGHVDFSAEMERTLQVLDYAVLIISGADGVQSHVETLWKLLGRYRVPVFLFVNKMDQEGTDQEALLAELKTRLSENCLDFSCLPGREAEGAEQFYESLALCDEEAMDFYLSHGSVADGQIIRLVRERKVFPCYFGSALKLWGVDSFLEGLSRFTVCPVYPEAFGARVFKISRDSQGSRLTHLKITGGRLRVKSLLTGPAGQWEEKVDQIRLYSGDSYETVQEVGAGCVCAVTGLTETFAGEGLGEERSVNLPILEPVLTYRLLVPEDCNLHTLLLQLRQLEEEEPLLRVLWQEEPGEIHVQLMGEVQTEVLKTLIWERFGVKVEFGQGSIVYKETILEPVEGVGHFEPLRHYAEVHLLLEPGEPGSGLVFSTACSEELLDRNWQRLVLTHLEEKKHRGVLTGSEIIDMKITLIAGRAHLKHTEGGDFRQATYRALRQGLKMGKCRLLEPVYAYRLEVPSEQVGRAMADIQKMSGTFSAPEPRGELSLLKGTAPVAGMQGYQREVMAYTGGRGRLACTFKGYEPCHQEEAVIAAIGYDSERDLENPTGSVFCAHGAGFVVEYDKVYDYMHLEGLLAGKKQESAKEARGPERTVVSSYNPELHDEKELEAIFRRTYGEVRRERRSWARTVAPRESSGGGPGYGRSGGGPGTGRANAGGRSGGGPETGRANAGGQKGVSAYGPGGRKKQASGEEYLLVDGYNIIFGWEELNELARASMEAARGRLMDILCNYQGYRKNVVILVFDAYKVEGNPGSSQSYHNIHVVYTKEAETADAYIEKVTHEIGRRHNVTVATSDALEQVIILGQGARRMSAQGLKEEIEAANIEIRRDLAKAPAGDKNYLFEHMSGDAARELENLRLGLKQAEVKKCRG